MKRFVGLHTSRRRRGLNLVEIAIVCAVFGLVLGGLWAVWSNMRFNGQLRTATQQLQYTIQNLRAALAEQSGIAGTTALLTTALDKMHVFPTEMRLDSGNPAGAIFHPFSSQTGVGLTGNVQAGSDDCAGNENQATPQPCFGLTYENLPQNACIRMVANTSGANIGLQRIVVNGTLTGDSNAGTLPISAANARAQCTSATANTVLWVYLLRDNKS